MFYDNDVEKSGALAELLALPLLHTRASITHHLLTASIV
jgi:hypothetical protein